MKTQRVACRPRARVGALLATLICVCAWLGAPAPTAARVTGADAQLRAAVAVERARPRAPRLSRELFLAQPVLRNAALSPDGRQVAYLLVHGDQRAVWLQASAGGPPRRLLADGQAERLHWTRDGRWLLLASPRQVFALAMAGQPGSGIVTALGGRSRRELLMVDPSQPAAIIVIEHPPRVSRAPRHWRAYRMAIGGRQALLREDAAQFIDLAFDAQGRLAWLLRVAVDKHLLMRVDASGGMRELARCTGTQRCQLLGTTAGGDLLLQASLGGDLERLLRIDSRGAIQALHGDPRGEADLDEVVLDPIGGAPLLAHYRSIVAASHGLTPEAQRHVAAIERSLPRRNLRIEVGRGPGAHWLVHERAPTLRGERLHLYAPATGRLGEIVADAGLQSQGRRLPRPPASAMARKLALTWRASDGMRLHGFLLVPPGIDPARAPLVTRVHGGPFNHDGPVFDADAQFLANRGYLVFEPNFRGSTGHGMAYKTAPRGDFGNGRVQRDIVEGTRHLLAMGIGDPSRVGIMGASFGGYSALLGLSFQPELFKVGIAAVPPADLGWVLRDYARGDTQWAGIPLATQLKLLALDPADPALAQRLAAQSPNANAGRMRRPLLLLAGGEDERVPIRGVIHYAARLKTLGRDVSLFVDADAGHGVEDARTREAYFHLMETLLHRQLGGPAPAPPSRALGEHLQRNLRLRGPGLGPPAP